jgi:hypothetical protein
MQIVHRLFPKANIDWARVIYSRSNGSPGFKIIGRYNDIDIVDGLQNSQIVQRMVRGAKCAITDPGADSNQLDRLV